MENSFGKPVEVEVRDSLEKAMKILKQKMSKEGILQELKRRRFYEKPSVKRKRKTREARKRLRREMKRRVVPATPRRLEQGSHPRRAHWPDQFQGRNRRHGVRPELQERCAIPAPCSA